MVKKYFSRFQTIMMVVLLFMFCISSLAAAAGDAPKYFTVWMKDGQRIDLLLSDKPVVKFAEGTLRFEASSTILEYKASDVDSFTLEATPSTGIHNVLSGGNDYKILQSGEMLYISNAEPNAQVMLYSVSGSIVMTSPADGQGRVSIPLNQLGRGAYVLKIKNNSFKIMKK